MAPCQSVRPLRRMQAPLESARALRVAARSEEFAAALRLSVGEQPNSVRWIHAVAPRVCEWPRSQGWVPGIRLRYTLLHLAKSGRWPHGKQHRVLAGSKELPL